MDTLEAEEVAGFGKYLTVQYPKEANALKVFRYYEHFFPNRQHPGKMALPYAYRKIFQKAPDAGMSDLKKIWNAFSKLYGWLKEYLVLTQLSSDQYLTDTLWLRVLQERVLNAEYVKATIKCHDTNYAQFFDVRACLQEIELGLHYKNQLTMQPQKPDDAALNACLWKVQEAAELIRIKMECERLTLFKVMSESDIISDALESKPLLQIYQQIHVLITTDEISCYLKIKNLTEQYADLIPPTELNNILRYMQNFVSKMIRLDADNVTWAVRYHELNKSLLAQNVVEAQHTMTPTNFQNIVNVACVAGDFDWVRQFVVDYAPFLPQKIRDENLNLAQASIAFEQKDYKKALKLTQKSEFKDERHIVRVKLIYLRALYELDGDTTNGITAFKTYLIRKKGLNKDASLAFLKMLDMLAQKKVTKEALNMEFKQTPNMFCRPWIKEKISSYKRTMYR